MVAKTNDRYIPIFGGEGTPDLFPEYTQKFTFLLTFVIIGLIPFATGTLIDIAFLLTWVRSGPQPESIEGSQDQSSNRAATPQQELMERPWRGAVYWLVHMDCSVYFLLLFFLVLF